MKKFVTLALALVLAVMATPAPALTLPAPTESTYELSLTPDRVHSGVQNLWYLLDLFINSHPPMPGIIPPHVLQGMTKIEVTMPQHNPGLVFVLGGFGGWWEQTDAIPWKDGKVTVTAADFPKCPSEVFIFDENNLGGGYIVIIDGDWEATWDDFGVTNITITYGPNMDTASDWAYEHITEAIDKGFVLNDLMGDYDRNITRADFVRLAMSWLRYSTGMTNGELLAEHGIPDYQDITFSDTDNANVLAAAGLGITAGIGGGLFGVEMEFDREQAAIMLMRVGQIAGTFKDDTSDFGFTDLSAAQWMPDAINFVGNNGIMAGKGEGRFAPKDSFQVQESITVFNKMG
jgi:hypothetical protein